MHLWEVSYGDELAPIARVPLDLESRLQNWMAGDIGILDPALLVIGREVATDFGGFIDILCVDSAGDLVIVELKRDRTPREITAQALDYASWVTSLPNERVTTIANDYLVGSFEAAFSNKFGTDLPDTLNGNHRILVVGSEIDASSERIIRYLSDEHGVNINAATFQYFRPAGGSELLARVFLIEPSEVEHNARTRGTSKLRLNLSYEQLGERAADAGVADLYQYAVAALEPLLQKKTTKSSIAFTAAINGSRKTVLSFIPESSSTADGLRYQLYKNRYAELTMLSISDVESLLPPGREDWVYTAGSDSDWEGFLGFFASRQEIDRLADPLRPSNQSG